MYHKCPECEESNWFDCNESRVVTKETDAKYQELLMKINKKIIDLQAQIITAYTDKSSAIASNPNDVLRYTAMVDVLKAMLN